MHPEGVEPPTAKFVAWYSIQLSYRCKFYFNALQHFCGEEGIRTHVPFREHAFQACALNHSATSPYSADLLSPGSCLLKPDIRLWKLTGVFQMTAVDNSTAQYTHFLLICQLLF